MISFNKNLQALSKLSENISRESNDVQLSTEMKSNLKESMDKLRRIQEDLPSTLKRNKNLLGYLQKFEDGLQQYQQWVNEARQLINRFFYSSTS